MYFSNRFLGNTGLQVSVLAANGELAPLGTKIAEEKALEILGTAFDNGINFFDSTEGHGAGSERIIGKAIKHFAWNRSDIVVATKINWGMVNGRNPLNNSGLSRKHIIEGLNNSLKRLGLDYVDLVYAHRPDRHTPIEETVRAFDYLINTGKAFYWGTAEWSTQEIQAAIATADRLGLIKPVMAYPKYNILHRNVVEVEHRLFATTNGGIGMGLTSMDPLSRGAILSGDFNHLAEEGAEASDHELKELGPDWRRRATIVKKLVPFAEKLGCSLRTLAIAWVLRNPKISSVILSATYSLADLHQSLEALQVQPKLTDEMVGEIDSIAGNQPGDLIMRIYFDDLFVEQ